MTGPMATAERMSRDECIQAARRLRAETDLTLAEIGELFGRAPSTIMRWTDEARAERDRAASRRVKESYRGTCKTCGASTNGSDGPGTASERCGACWLIDCSANATWTRARLIAEAFRWHHLVGQWPTRTDWHSHGGPLGVAPGTREARLEFHALTGPWPNDSSVDPHFGTWADFMAAAGGTAPGTCKGVGHGQRERELRAATRRVREAGTA